MPLCIVRRVLILATVLVLVGCAKEGVPPDVQRWKPVLQLAVQTATARLIADHPQTVPLVPQVAGGLRLIAQEGNVQRVLPQLLQVLQQRIPWDKIPPDLRPLVGALVTFIGNELSAVAARWQIPESELVALLGEVADWVMQTAQQQGRG